MQESTSQKITNTRMLREASTSGTYEKEEGTLQCYAFLYIYIYITRSFYHIPYYLGVFLLECHYCTVVPPMILQVSISLLKYVILLTLCVIKRRFN